MVATRPATLLEERTHVVQERVLQLSEAELLIPSARHSESRFTIASMTLRRAAFVTVVAAGCGLGLSACTAPPSSHGTLGLLRADEGDLHAIVQMCSRHINGVTVRDVDGPDEY